MKNHKIVIFIVLVSCQLVNAQDIEQVIKADPFKFSGSISGRTGLANVSGIDDRTSPFHYLLNTRLNFSFYGFDVPVYFSIRNNSFQYGAIVPRFKIRPKYKWVELQLGDILPKMNPYLMDNRNMRGVGLKLTPGKIRFHATYGRMRELRSFRDTLLLGTIDDQVYTRPVASIGIGYGSNRNHFDLYAVRAWDDKSKEFYEERNTSAQSNTLIGTTFKLKLSKGLNIHSNVGFSVLTLNTNVSGNTTEIYKNNLTGSLADLNATSNVNFAGDVGLNYKYKNIGFNGQIRYIQPHYQPLTVAYINTDLIDYTIGSTVSLFKNKIYLNSRVGIQSNNISKVDEITNKRVIFSILGKWTATKKISTTFLWNNYTTNLEAKSIQINELYTYSINNQMLSVGLNYRNPSPINQFYFTLRGGQSNFTTVSSNENNGEYGSYFSNLNFGYDLESRGLDCKIGLGYNQYNRAEIITQTTTLNANISKSVLQKKLTLAIANAYTLIDVESFREGTNLLSQFSANWKITKKNNMGLQIMRLRRSSYIRPTYTEWRSYLTARQNF